MTLASDLPPLRALRVLATVSRFERFGDAAAELGVTTSAISQQIRLLEQWIGTEVFDRSTKSPRLTPAGRRLVEGISAPLARIDGICRAIRRSHAQSSVVVSAPGAYLSYRLIPALHEFWQQHPDVHVDLRMAARFDSPAEGEDIDLAIRFLHDHDSGSPLGRRGWRAVCHRTHYDALGRPQSLADLQGGLFLHESIFNFWPMAFEEAGAAIPEGVDFRGVGDASHVMAAVTAGNAMALLPAELTQAAIRDGTLVTPFTVGIEPAAGYFALLGAEEAKPAVRDLVKFLQESA